MMLMLSHPRSTLQYLTSSPKNLGLVNGSPPAKLTFLIPASDSIRSPRFASSRGRIVELSEVWKQNWVGGSSVGQLRGRWGATGTRTLHARLQIRVKK